MIMATGGQDHDGRENQRLGQSELFMSGPPCQPGRARFKFKLVAVNIPPESAAEHPGRDPGDPSQTVTDDGRRHGSAALSGSR